MKENHLKEVIELNKNIDNLKKDNFEEFQKKEKAFLKLNEDNSKIISDKELKITELKEQIKKLNESLLNYQKIKTDLENIALKQEDKINELGYKVTKIETILKNKNLEIKQNEDYAVQLMNIIKEQKVQMQNLVNNNQEKENDLIKSLKNNIENLKNSIEIKENTIQTIQKSHKILQDKFLKLCSDKRKKEQEDLLIQVKEMKIKKNEREKGNLSINRNNSKNKNKKNNKEENKNFIPKIDIRGKQTTTINSNDNYINSNNISNILPVIANQNDKIKEEKNELSNLKLDISDDGGKMDEINSMMKKIIEEF